MREMTITKNAADQRLDRFLQKALPALPPALAQKYIRLKRIKVDGKRTERGYRLCEGDTIQFYISDEFFETIPDAGLYRTITHPNLTVCYEDDHILIVDKPPNLLCHSGTSPDEITLVDQVKAYLYRSGAWNPETEQSFTPALCNRLDRNTGGLVISAKTAAAQRILNEKIRDGQVDKYYLLAVEGCPQAESGRIEGQLIKDRKQNIVRTADKNADDSVTAITEYRTIETKGDLSLVECKLITGRSHQIRVQMAGLGTPLLGDRKYGGGGDEPYQALWAYKIHFRFTTDAGALAYLNDQEFYSADIPFAAKYFGKDGAFCHASMIK